MRGTGPLSAMLSFAAGFEQDPVFHCASHDPHLKILLTSFLKCFELEVWSECCYSLSGGPRVSEQSRNINSHLIKLKRNSPTVYPLGNKPLHLLGFNVKINDFLPVLKEVLLPESGKFFS